MTVTFDRAADDLAALIDALYPPRAADARDTVPPRPRTALAAPPPPLVGLLGRARAGKDTVAARLVEAHGFRRYAFADALKEAALIADPIVVPVDTVAGSRRLSEVVAEVGWEGAKEIREVRRTLQQVGVGVRHLDPHFWVSVVMDEVTDPTRRVPVVITDVRFPNEAASIRAAGGTLVRVVRPGQDESDRHVSEVALLDHPVAAEITNGSTLAALRAQVDALAHML
ncbi:deoxynucleotide monophosphate kinase family protein [Micromonospora okii]|uniref:deoxynucleotide monophosphate kinase family protein n=1 Tax=Micromonospora okii TaxID=1182970 RepID=UPI001E3DD42F|nr:hypothetical protein [Micromonospora okii]